MTKELNHIYEGANGRKSLYDVFISPNKNAPVLLFAHGYKGYKDWGCWNLMGNYFLDQGLSFVKFNFSHNGGTVDNSIDFPDLEAFGHNDFGKELKDFKTMYQLTQEKFPDAPIYIVGHSRGGGIAQLFTASLDPQPQGLILLASVADFAPRFVGDIEGWKEQGVTYIENARTKQQMPHFYAFYEDWLANKDQYDIPKINTKITCKTLIIHGENDDTVLTAEAHQIHQNIAHSELVILPETDHVFNACQPWKQDEMPKQSLAVVEHITQFVKAQ